MFNKDVNKDYHRRNRKLAYSAVGTPDYVAPEVQGKSRNINIQSDTIKQSIGGRWELYFLRCLWGILPLLQSLLDKLGTKYKTGESFFVFLPMQMWIFRLLTLLGKNKLKQKTDRRPKIKIGYKWSRINQDSPIFHRN